MHCCFCMDALKTCLFAYTRINAQKCTTTFFKWKNHTRHIVLIGKKCAKVFILKWEKTRTFLKKSASVCDCARSLGKSVTSTLRGWRAVARQSACSWWWPGAPCWPQPRSTPGRTMCPRGIASGRPDFCSTCTHTHKHDKGAKRIRLQYLKSF